MRIDTLSYRYTIKASLSDFYHTLVQEQFAYFKRQDDSLTELKEGTHITCQLTTKMRKSAVSSTMDILKLDPNSCFQMETKHSAGVILQTYDFKQLKNGKTQVTYSERNTFDKSRNQANFAFTGLLYKFMYNRGIKQRLNYIDEEAVKG